MGFHSVLSPTADSETTALAAPAFFRDLNLDQIFNAVTAGWQDYDLKPFFHAPLRDSDVVVHRQKVFQDLEHRQTGQAVNDFSEQMRSTRTRLNRATKSQYKYEKQGWFFGAIQLYCEALKRLHQDLQNSELGSRGLLAFQEFLTSYLQSGDFQALTTESGKLKADLAAVAYSLHLGPNCVTVQPYNGEPDYSGIIEKTFEKFRHAAVRDYRIRLVGGAELNHIEAQVLDRVALLNPEVFAALDGYCARYASFFNPTISRFDREIQFYIAYLTYLDKFRSKGLTFSYPQISRTTKEVRAGDAFDLALADKLITEGAAVVCNDFFLHRHERLFVVTGPNQGGKTTFARMFGQLHYLCSLGCAVPGSDTRLLLCDNIFTHFEKQEDISNLRGKLQDDLLRIKEILDQATPSSIVLINEIFSSTTVSDALYLSKRLMEKIVDLDLSGVWVTFLGELARSSDKTVSLVSNVDSREPTIRTYKLERRPPEGNAYAIAIAQKYRLTREALVERIK